MCVIVYYGYYAIKWNTGVAIGYYQVVWSICAVVFGFVFVFGGYLSKKEDGKLLVCNDVNSSFYIGEFNFY